ncbi:hypothetical protein ACXC9Q_05375 [Kribbella sp. CWNU-51]
MPRIGGRRSIVAALVTVALLVVPMACSDSSTQGQSGPSVTVAPPATSAPTTDCAAASALKSSLADLANVKPLQDGLTALTTAIANVKSSLGVAVAAASAALQPAVQSVKAAFSQLETAASGLSADNLRQQAPQINSALQQVGSAATSFATTLTQSCPAG